MAVYHITHPTRTQEDGLYGYASRNIFSRSHIFAQFSGALPGQTLQPVGSQPCNDATSAGLAGLSYPGRLHRLSSQTLCMLQMPDVNVLWVVLHRHRGSAYSKLFGARHVFQFILLAFPVLENRGYGPPHN